MSRPTLSLLAVLGLVASACGVVDDLGSSDDAIEVTPVDTENWARFSLLLPTGSCQPGQSCSRPLGSNPSITIDGNAIALGVVTRLKPGEHTLSTNGGSTKITLAPGEVRSYTLPVARSKCTAATLPGVPTTDFGKTVTLTNAQCPTAVRGTAIGFTTASPTLNNVEPFFAAGCGSALTTFGQGPECSAYQSYTIVSARVAGGACFNVPAVNAQTACNAAKAGNWAWLASGGSLEGADRVFVPDTYSVKVGGESQTFTLEEGDLSEVEIALPVVGAVPSVFKTKVNFADTRKLPNGSSNPSITSSCTSDRSYTFAATASGSVNLSAFVDSSCIYTLNAGGRTTTLSQSAANTITINRIDVGDVVVTREDGSTYKVRGSFDLFFGGNRVVAGVPTDRGVDVLPGTYELVISYATIDGPKTQRHTLSL